MIAVKKLMSLGPTHRARKAAQALGHIEADYRLGNTDAASWVAEAASAFARDTARSDELRTLASRVAESSDELRLAYEGTRLVNMLARGLEAEAGLSPADWDFKEPLSDALSQAQRKIFPGVRAFLEDIRAPFNVGSILRSADAFGAAEILLSGFTADPLHPRAARSAMGACAVVPWRKGSLEELQRYGEVFALELRGTNIDEFVFPENGIVILGSEELGVSPEALSLCRRTVSIPMLGSKGSLNVGVAFGIVMNAWRASLTARGVFPEYIPSQASEACYR